MGPAGEKYILFADADKDVDEVMHEMIVSIFSLESPYACDEVLNDLVYMLMYDIGFDLEDRSVDDGAKVVLASP